jgi:hypothetical protein
MSFQEGEMVGLYIIGGLILVGIGALTFFKIKWSRADRVVASIRAERIEKKRIEAEAKADGSGSS